MPGLRAALRLAMVLSVLVTLLVTIVLVSPSTSAKGPREMVVSGEALSATVRLNTDESFAFMFGSQVAADIDALYDRPYLTFEIIGGAFEGQARLYLGTQAEPPLFLIGPLSRSSTPARLGPHPLAILALHGIPLRLTDPFRLADPADDPPAVFSGGRQILPVALPAAGGGGLADGSGNGPQPLLWAILAALVVGATGAGLRVARQRR